MAEQRFETVPGTRFGPVEWVSEIPSTNSELLERARRGVAEGAVIVADLQTAGRGRRGRSWTAPPGTALMMSVLLRPPKDSLSPSKASLVTSAFANAAAAAVSAQLGVELGVKWPNDLVVDAALLPELATTGDRRADPGYRKVAGILTESVISGATVDALVVGMGLNTGWPEVPEELALVASSLNLLSGTEVDRAALAQDILEGFEPRYAALLAPGGSSQVLDEVRRRSATLGREVRVEFVEDHLAGLAVDLDEEGHLVVRDGHGVDHVVSVGDVVHLRPAGA